MKTLAIFCIVFLAFVYAFPEDEEEDAGLYKSHVYKPNHHHMYKPYNHHVYNPHNHHVYRPRKKPYYKPYQKPYYKPHCKHVCKSKLVCADVNRCKPKKTCKPAPHEWYGTHDKGYGSSYHSNSHYGGPKHYNGHGHGHGYGDHGYQPYYGYHKVLCYFTCPKKIQQECSMQKKCNKVCY